MFGQKRSPLDHPSYCTAHGIVNRAGGAGGGIGPNPEVNFFFHPEISRLNRRKKGFSHADSLSRGGVIPAVVSTGPRKGGSELDGRCLICSFICRC